MPSVFPGQTSLCRETERLPPSTQRENQLWLSNQPIRTLSGQIHDLTLGWFFFASRAYGGNNSAKSPALDLA
jgi:hypothetical protein